MANTNGTVTTATLTAQTNEQRFAAIVKRFPHNNEGNAARKAFKGEYFRQKGVAAQAAFLASIEASINSVE